MHTPDAINAARADERKLVQMLADNECERTSAAPYSYEDGFMRGAQAMKNAIAAKLLAEDSPWASRVALETPAPNP